jgi:hypothetical protein
MEATDAWPSYVILDPEIGNGHVPVPCEPDEWARWSEEHASDRRVGKDMVGTVMLSTVFLGLDHSFGAGPPLYFETMAFDESDVRTNTIGDRSYTHTATVDDVFERYSTWEAAELGHAEWLAKLRERMEVAADAPG